MSDINTLINLGEISKPATVLIEKVSNAVGGFFKPYQIKRTARAEVIKAQTKIDITELQRRALGRFLRNGVRMGSSPLMALSRWRSILRPLAEHGSDHQQKTSKASSGMQNNSAQGTVNQPGSPIV